MMNTGKHCAAALLAALLSAAALTGCYKGDGTEVIAQQAETVPAAAERRAEEDDAAFAQTKAEVSPAAKTDYPFSFDAQACERPKQEIVMVMIYDAAEQPLQHDQTVNYFDRDGNCYRYRQALDLEGNWMDVLYDHYRSGAPAVSRMSEEETRTLWYFSGNAAVYKDAGLAVQDPGKEVYGVKWLYTVSERDEAVLLGRYDDVCAYADKPEVPAFLNWFRYYFHNSFQFGNQ